MSGILLSLPNLAEQVEIWQNGLSSLAAMAEHPIFCQYKIVSDMLAHPVFLVLILLKYPNGC